MSDHYTPSLDEIRRHWGLAVDVHRRTERLAEFDRAVIELTAELDAYREENTRHREKNARVEALAEKHETTARNMGSGSYGGALAAKIAQEIRAALNGETDD